MKSSPSPPRLAFSALGGMDVGKTTFTRRLVNRLTTQGQRAAIVDGDLGQSEIGPPACVGMAFADAPLLAPPTCPLTHSRSSAARRHPVICSTTPPPCAAWRTWRAMPRSS